MHSDWPINVFENFRLRYPLRFLQLSFTVFDTILPEPNSIVGRRDNVTLNVIAQQNFVDKPIIPPLTYLRARELGTSLCLRHVGFLCQPFQILASNLVNFTVYYLLDMVTPCWMGKGGLSLPLMKIDVWGSPAWKMENYMKKPNLSAWVGHSDKFNSRTLVRSSSNNNGLLSIDSNRALLVLLIPQLVDTVWRWQNQAS